MDVVIPQVKRTVWKLPKCLISAGKKRARMVNSNRKLMGAGGEGGHDQSSSVLKNLCYLLSLFSLHVNIPASP